MLVSRPGLLKPSLAAAHPVGTWSVWWPWAGRTGNLAFLSQGNGGSLVSGAGL